MVTLTGIFENLSRCHHQSQVVETSFSNSLIIHKEKTKEITAVTVVWIPDLN